MNNPTDSIIDLAEAMASQYVGPSGSGDPLAAFNDDDVIYIEDDYENDFEGLLRFYEGEYQVFVNVGHGHSRSEGRVRFTAAHELGHYSILAHRQALRDGSGIHKCVTGFNSKNSIEREADIFAAHFLLPTNRLMKFCGKVKWGAHTILDVARAFKTSITCAALRCQAALPGNSTLIFWTQEEVRWQRTDNDWYFQLPARTIRTADKLLTGSATERVLGGEIVDDSGFLRRGTTRSAWFPRIAPWSSDNEILIEEAIPLGTIGVLTLLRPDR